MGGPHDLFKRMNAELKKTVDMTLAKTNRSTQFDIGQSSGFKWIVKVLPKSIFQLSVLLDC